MDAAIDLPAAMAQLYAQHDELRSLADECEDLADDLEAGGAVGGALGRCIGRLRVAFATHNEFEERILHRLLTAATPATGVDLLLDAHLREHRALRSTLEGQRAAGLREVLHDLREHLAHEERYFAISRSVLTGAAAVT